MKKEAKIQEVKNLKERLEKSKAFIFTGYRGLKVADVSNLRKSLREGNNWMKVAKNCLIKRILEEQGLEELADYVLEPTAIAAAEEDVVSLAKTLKSFSKDHAALDIRGGYVEGKKVSKDDIQALAMLPSREELIAKSLSCMMAPGNNMVGVLAALPRKLLYALNAIKETKSA